MNQSAAEFDFLRLLQKPNEKEQESDDLFLWPLETTVEENKFLSGFKEKRKAENEDEIKRKRNCLASAKFRQKKKEQERQMEEKINELSQENLGLKSKVSELEKEVKWLRELLLEKTNK